MPKIILFSTLFVFLGIHDLKADAQTFNIICEFSTETSFRITTRSQEINKNPLNWIEAGFYFRGVETGSPSICRFNEHRSHKSNNDLINLFCEDPNIGVNYELIFNSDFKNSPFEILKKNFSNGEDERLIPCFEVKKL